MQSFGLLRHPLLFGFTTDKCAGDKHNSSKAFMQTELSAKIDLKQVPTCMAVSNQVQTSSAMWGRHNLIPNSQPDREPRDRAVFAKPGLLRNPRLTAIGATPTSGKREAGSGQKSFITNKQSILRATHEVIFSRQCFFGHGSGLTRPRALQQANRRHRRCRSQ